MKKIVLGIGVLVGFVGMSQDTTETKVLNKKVQIIVEDSEDGSTKEIVLEGKIAEEKGELKITTFENDSTKKVIIIKGEEEDVTWNIPEAISDEEMEQEIDDVLDEIEDELDEVYGRKDSSISSGIQMDYDDFGFLSGINFQTNMFLNEDLSMAIPGTYNFLELDPSKSFRLSYAFFDKYIPIARNNFGLITGLDLNLLTFGFKGDFTLTEDTLGGLSKINYSDRVYTQNKLKAAYIQIPVLLQVASGQNASNSFHLAVGGYGGLRIASKTKEVYTEDGRERKDKTKDDFKLNGLQYGLQAIIGYGNVSLNVRYGLSNTFDIKDLNLKTLSTGITLHF